MSQWLDVMNDPVQMDKIRQYRESPPAAQQEYMRRSHHRNIDMLTFLQLLSNIPSEYARRVAVPMFSAKTLRNAWSEYGPSINESLDFKDLMDNMARQYKDNGRFTQHQLDIVQDLCMYCYLFGGNSFNILAQLRKRFGDLHNIANDIYFALGGVTNIPDVSFRDYFLHILSFNNDNFLSCLASYSVLQDREEDLTKLTPFDIHQIVVADQQGAFLGEDKLALRCNEVGKLYELSSKTQRELYIRMQTLINARGGADRIPTREFRVNFDEFMGSASDIPSELEQYWFEHSDEEASKNTFVACRRIPYDDPRQFFLGHDSEYSCCYHWDGMAESAVEYSISSPDAGNYEIVIEDGDGNVILKLATSFVWAKDGGICFDNIETSIHREDLSGISVHIIEELSEIFVKEYGYNVAVVGISNGIYSYEWKGCVASGYIDKNNTEILLKYGLSESELEFYNAKVVNGSIVSYATMEVPQVIYPPENVYTDAKDQVIIYGNHNFNYFPPPFAIFLSNEILDILDEDIDEESRKNLVKLLFELCKNSTTNYDKDSLSSISISQAKELAKEQVEKNWDYHVERNIDSISDEELIESYDYLWEDFVREELGGEEEEGDREKYKKWFASSIRGGGILRDSIAESLQDGMDYLIDREVNQLRSDHYI